MKIFSLQLILLFFLYLGNLQSQQAAEKKKVFDWPQWRGPDRNSISKETNWSHDWPKEGPRLLWKFNMGSGFSPPSVSQGRVYIEGTREEMIYIYCLNAETGEKIWEYPYEYPLNRKGGRGFFCPGPTSTPTVEGDRVYAYSRAGQFFCLDSRTGKLIWSDKNKIFTSHHGLACSPLIQGDLVIVLSGTLGVKNMIQAHHKITGKLVWSAIGGRAECTSPVRFQYGKEPALAFMSPGSVFGVSLKNGKKLFSHPWRGHHNIAEPVIIDDKLFVGQEYLIVPDGPKLGSVLFQIPKEPGELTPIWKNANLATQVSTAIYWKGFLYGMVGNHTYWPGLSPSSIKGIRCIDFLTGEIKWTQYGILRSRNRMTLGGNFMLAGERFIILTKAGDLVILKARPDKYEELARSLIFQREVKTQKEALSYAPPVLSNQRIYLRSTGETTLKTTMTGLKPGWLLCLDVSEKKPVVSKNNIPVAKKKNPQTGN